MIIESTSLIDQQTSNDNIQDNNNGNYMPSTNESIFIIDELMLPGVAHFVKNFGTSKSPKYTQRRDDYIDAVGIPGRKSLLRATSFSDDFTLHLYASPGLCGYRGLADAPAPDGAASMSATKVCDFQSNLRHFIALILLIFFALINV